VRDALIIAQRELREQLRNPSMLVGLVVVAASAALIPALGLRLRHLLPSLPQMSNFLGLELPAQLDVAALGDRLAWTFNTVLFGEGMALPGVLAAHAILHDRQLGTLEAILATPLRASSYVAGKLLGVIALPSALLLAVALLGLIVAGPLDGLGPQAGLLPGSGSWWLALALGAPLQASLFSLLGLTFSSRVRDTRTAQQWTYAVLGLVPMGPGIWLAAPGRGLAEIFGMSLLFVGITAAGLPLVARLFDRGEVLSRG